MADSLCIGWQADPPCPVHGRFHGCVQPDGHDIHGGSPERRRHRCACGTVPAPEVYNPNYRRGERAA